MRVLLIGSTQTKHIVSIYKDCGWKCYTLASTKGNCFAVIKNCLRLMRSNTVYYVGGLDYKTNKYLRLANFLGKRVIIHWIGTDVMLQAERYKRTGELINSDVINLAVSPHLKDELESVHIKSTYIPIVPRNIPYPQACKMPTDHAVMVYLPEEKKEFYGWAQVKYLAAIYPDIPFYIVKNDGIDEENIPSNVEFKGDLSHDELEELYKRVSILLRYTQHDGLPVMMLEAQGMGRKVIHRYGFPYAVTPVDDSKEALLKAFEEIVSRPPEIDSAAIEYVNATFSHAKMIELYKQQGLA